MKLLKFLLQKEGHNLLPLKEWSSRKHQQGDGGHFKEDNQLQ
jgi:hypothetical protein